MAHTSPTRPPSRTLLLNPSRSAGQIHFAAVLPRPDRRAVVPYLNAVDSRRAPRAASSAAGRDGSGRRRPSSAPDAGWRRPRAPTVRDGGACGAGVREGRTGAVVDRPGRPHCGSIEERSVVRSWRRGLSAALDGRARALTRGRSARRLPPLFSHTHRSVRYIEHVRGAPSCGVARVCSRC